MRRAVVLVLAALVTGCDGGKPAPASTSTPAPPSGPAWFRDEARERGIDFAWQSGHAERHYFPEIMGGGAALFDLEGDGDLDAYLVQAGPITAAPETRPPDQLFVNQGEGRFRAAGEASGVRDREFGMGVAAGDYDDDGKTDLYVTNVGPNALLRNRGDSTLEDTTAAAGVGDPSWSTSAGFLDHDRDGDLDLFVVNYIRWSVASEMTCYSKPHPEDYCSPNSYNAPAPSTLYLNEGGGRFRDVSYEAGLRAAFGNGLGIVASDFDGDGWTDVFVANDGMLNLLWKNDADGTFTDVGVRSGCAVDQDGRKKAGMGTDAADVDFDGDEDLLVVNLAGETDSYYRNDQGRFSDRTALAGLSGVSRPFTRFGTGFADFDQDGLLDLYIANGRVTRAADYGGPRPFDEPNLLLRGLANGRFEEVHPRGGTGELLVATSRAAAFGDVDGDGAIDVLVANRDGPAYLLMNRVEQRGASIGFRVLEKSGRDALGAVLRCRAGERSILRSVRSAYSYCAASDPRVHIGLGAGAGVEEVDVQWADGERERFPGQFAAGAVHVLARGKGTPVKADR